MWVCDDDNLRHLLLSNNEWNHLEKLVDVLKVFTQVTQVISSAGTPTLPWVIPMYELMQRHLSSKANMKSLLFEIQSTCREALGKLDKYYTMAVNCQYNILATRKQMRCLKTQEALTSLLQSSILISVSCTSRNWVLSACERPKYCLSMYTNSIKLSMMRSELCQLRLFPTR